MSIWDDRDPHDRVSSGINPALGVLQYAASSNTTLAAVLSRLSKSQPLPMAWYLDQLGDA